MNQLTRGCLAAVWMCIGGLHPGPWMDARAQSAGVQPAPLPAASIDTLVGPIALYPDALVLQILECSVDPAQVRRLSAWMQKNPELKGTAAQDAALSQGFAPSFVAIVIFPQVVQMMDDDPRWTTELGQAFTRDRSGVFASLQRLRAQAKAMGNLNPTEQQDVQTVTTSSGEQVIVIQPTNPQVVYVPAYSPSVVYTQPYVPGQAAAAGLIGFTTGVIIGGAIADDHNDDYWGYHGGISNDNYEDYVDHRENMAAQRGQNQTNRQSTRTENRSTRQSSASSNQSQRQKSNSQYAPAQSASTRTAAARGSSTTASTAERTGTNSGAMSGYQSGSATREASARGRSSSAQRSQPSTQSRSRPSGGSRGGGRRG